MKRNPELDTLVGDLFAGDDPGLTGDIALECLRQGGRLRQRARTRAWTMVAVAIPVLLVAGVLLREPLSQRAPSNSPGTAIEIVHSIPLTSGQVIATDAGASAIEIVRSDSSSSTVEWVSDRQLLALTEGRPAILINPGSRDARLLFADALEYEPDGAGSSILQ